MNILRQFTADDADRLDASALRFASLCLTSSPLCMQDPTTACSTS